MTYPLRHISIRVPWHDTSWDGRVCAKPNLNSACLKLKNIGRNRNDAAEVAVAGLSIRDLDQEQWPCCVSERVGFMAPFEYTRNVSHPYNRRLDSLHSHFKATPLRHPAYSAAAVPFAWMLSENMESLAQTYGLDVRPEHEPNLGFDSSWVQDYRNQTELLDCFAGHLQAQKSLCFFYAKQVPFVEDLATSRVLIGVGRILHVGDIHEYAYTTAALSGKPRSMLWERMIQHSIRPDFTDGFLLPYHAALEKASVNPDFDPADIAALSPADRLLEFSHASQLVTHDGALASLLACAESLQKAKTMLEGPWDACLGWLNARLGELWKARGPYPGLGAALSAFGLDSGTLIAHILAEKVEENGDPWPFVEHLFTNPHALLPGHLVQNVGLTLRETWQGLQDERRTLLKLISRFDVTAEEATILYVEEERRKAGIDVHDRAIIENPYLVYEFTRLSATPISVWTADRGVFPDASVRERHPLPAPSALDTGTDARRVRSLTVSLLEDAAAEGSTVVSQEQVVLKIREMTLQPPCPVTSDLMNIAKRAFAGTTVEVTMASGGPAFQLGRLAETAETIRSAVDRRLKGRRLPVSADWRTLLDAYLALYSAGPSDELEERARAEKTAALKELAESRVSALVGPAGTGKTTLLSVLCSHPEIARGGVLLLAPTGKARVRMEESTKVLKLKGYTIAQFLSPDRYDGSTGRYKLVGRPGDAGARTVIVDEASMLTEEMLAALIEALKVGVDRLILIGDPRQLPPIGPGRPFVDIVNRLAPEDVADRFPKVGPGYAELTIRRRQIGEEREDLRLAEWFSGLPLAPGEDDVFDKVARPSAAGHIHFVRWDTPEELRLQLIDSLVRELKLDGPDDVAAFDARLGGVPYKDTDLRFFNAAGNGKPGAAELAEGWQILSPVRSTAHGVPSLNRYIHKQFRQATLERSRKERNRKYPKPMGAEEIVYGDKVINLTNTRPGMGRFRHRKVYPETTDPYIANGEIGMAVGLYKGPKMKKSPWKLEVEFSSQPGYKYDYREQDFAEEGNPVLELAYALTVHKSQGSEFDTVILVLPNPCRLLSRELLYTALTRHKSRIVILHQGDVAEVRRYSSDDRSETARRLTNLFRAAAPVAVGDRFFEDYLIHRTARGEMVRSKSEVIIADHLAARGVAYTYEKPLTIGSETRYPDFTVDDAETGMTIYWEHCGMLHVPKYLQRWEEKLSWYRSHKILPHEEGGGEAGTLVVTRDQPNGGIDSASIDVIIKRVLGV